MYVQVKSILACLDMMVTNIMMLRTEPTLTTNAPNLDPTPTPNKPNYFDDLGVEYLTHLTYLYV